MGATDQRKTPSGIEVPPSVDESHLVDAGVDIPRDVGHAGIYPFTRGIAHALDADEPWRVAQYAGFGSGNDATERLRELIREGQRGLYLALDLPTQMGLDSDDPLAVGEVGRVGFAIDTVDDLRDLFDGLELENVREIRTTANGIGPLMLAMFIVLFEEMAIDPNRTVVRLQNDVLKEYIARGCYVVAPAGGLELGIDVLEYCARELPGWGGLAVSGPHIRNAGATAVEELAFMLVNARAYLQSCQRRNLDLAAVGRSTDFLMSAQMDLFEEVAKFRAARRLWARMLHDEFGVTDEQALALQLNLFTSGLPLTAQQPLNNLVRVTVEALALILGGGNVLGTSSYDEALGIPTEDAAMLALRTQQILRHECGLDRVVDPLGGSYYVELLTSQLEEKALEVMAEVETLGGAVAGIQAGYQQSRIADSAYAHTLAVESGERVIVGVNRYVSDSPAFSAFKVSFETEHGQVRRLESRREERNNAAVCDALMGVDAALAAGVNTVAATITAVRARATVGEICDVWRARLGRPQEGVQV